MQNIKRVLVTSISEWSATKFNYLLLQNYIEHFLGTICIQ